MELTQGNGGTSSHGSGRRLSDQDLDRMVDAYFDRELNVAQRRQMFDELSGQGGRCEDIARMQRIVAQLREPPEPIDIADDVIARVNGRRAFLSPRMRSAIRVGRMAVAASVLLALLGIVVVQRIAPDATTLVAESTPVTSLMQNTGEDLSRLRTSLAGVSEQAAFVLVPLGGGARSDLAFEPEVAVGPFAGSVSGTQPRGTGPRRLDDASSELVVLSSAGDNQIFAAHWYNKHGVADSQWVALDAELEWSRGFRSFQSETSPMGLTSRPSGESARVVPYYVEHFEVGDLPVSIDPEACRSVLRLISRKSEAIDVSGDPDR